MLDTANPHCVEKIVSLSEQEEVIASEDIVDERGIKLWAKGKPVSRQLQERLLQRKLLRPLESTLTIATGVEFADVIAACRQQIAENEVLRRIAGSREALGMLSDHKSFHLPGPLKLLLSAERNAGSRSYSNSVLVVAICAGIAARLQLSERDAGVLLLAGLLHDLGEIYVNPEYLRSDRRLAPSEWKHVASHPRVGQMVIRDLTSLPAAVGLAVLHHHERRNGSGYPGQLSTATLDRTGAMLAIADSVAAIASRGGHGCAYRIGLALRIVPEEFDAAAAQAVISALSGVFEVDPGEADCACLNRIRAIMEQAAQARALAESLAADASCRFSAEIARSVLEVLGHLVKAIHATGVASAAEVVDFESDPALVAEVCLIAKEIGWRLRNMSRIVQLRSETESPASAAKLAPLIACLDGSGLADGAACATS